MSYIDQKVPETLYVGKGVDEYSAADMDGIREDWSTYAITSIFK
ncbi:hypothetical protein HanIR_Chr10g0481251 [Helianthus annuus]|nr:hypothetical protein HanIR_Chr10g0481251 [Helianthus annuus]